MELMKALYELIYMYIIRVYSTVVVQSLCLTVCNPKDCSKPGSSVHGIFQAGILEWIAISFSNMLYISISHEILHMATHFSILSWRIP